MFDIVTVPCLRDNYAYLVRAADGGRAVLIDAPDATPIEAELGRRGWDLGAILITHHHDDHVAGVDQLRDRFGALVFGAAADRARLPRLDTAVSGGDAAGIDDIVATVIEVPGHTSGHIAFHLPEAEALFSADSLMIMGCGRLFEGTPADMWGSLCRLAALPPATRVFSGHEYAEANMRFARSIEPDSPSLAARAASIAAARADSRPTVGATLAEERATNPFLRSGEPAMKALLGMTEAPDVEVFAELRRRKDRF